MTENVKTAAPKILEIIKASNNILLHCHIFPDADSVGSALAMKFALEQLGKKATVIRGDSEIPAVFMNFPGAQEIVQKNIFEIDLAQFDLFLIQDSGALDRVSVIKEIVLPETMKTVVIDHHASNTQFGKDLNLVDISYPSTTLILADFFKEWKINLTHDMAVNLFMGSYTDTGGFKFKRTMPETFLAVAELVRAAPDFSDYIFYMDNNRSPFELYFEGLALSNIEQLCGGILAISAVSAKDIEKMHIPLVNINGGMMANILKSVVGWEIGVCMTEVSEGMIKVSFRTRDAEKYDLSQIAASMGGGGHKAAAGVIINDLSLADAKKKIVAAVEEYVRIGGQK